MFVDLLEQVDNRLLEKDFSDVFQPLSGDEIFRRKFVTTAIRDRYCHLCGEKIGKGKKMIRLGYGMKYWNVCRDCAMRLGRIMEKEND